MTVYHAGNKWYGAAGGAYVKFGGRRSKLVFRDNGLIANNRDKLGITMRSPRSTVLGAKCTAAYPDWDLGSITWPMQRVTDVPAVTLAFDLHGYWLHRGWRVTTTLSGTNKLPGKVAVDYLRPLQCLVGRLMGNDGHQKYRITKYAIAAIQAMTPGTATSVTIFWRFKASR